MVFASVEVSPPSTPFSSPPGRSPRASRLFGSSNCVLALVWPKSAISTGWVWALPKAGADAAVIASAAIDRPVVIRMVIFFSERNLTLNQVQHQAGSISGRVDPIIGAKGRSLCKAVEHSAAPLRDSAARGGLESPSASLRPSAANAVCER